MNVRLYITPIEFGKNDLADATVAVIDVLRCTTSLPTALKAGARGVIPTEGPGRAGELAARLGADTTILAGERHGVRIENFHLGNSPDEFTPESVGGKNVVMTTTNGTIAFGRAKNGGEVYSCAMVNVSRVAEQAARRGKDLAVVCAGTDGEFSLEDTLCGGLLIDLVSSKFGAKTELNDAAALATLLHDRHRDRLRDAIAEGEHGRFLASIGFAHDIDTAAAVDTVPVLPVLREGRLVLEEE